MSPVEVAKELQTLAGSVRRLSPSHQNPEEFYIQKETIAQTIAKLAREIKVVRA